MTNLTLLHHSKLLISFLSDVYPEAQFIQILKSSYCLRTYATNALIPFLTISRQEVNVRDLALRSGGALAHASNINLVPGKMSRRQ